MTHRPTPPFYEQNQPMPVLTALITPTPDRGPMPIYVSGMTVAVPGGKPIL